MLVRTEACLSSAAAPAFSPFGVVFNGTTWARRTGSIGAVDGKQGIVSFWFWIDVNTTTQNVFNTTGGTFRSQFVQPDSLVAARCLEVTTGTLRLTLEADVSPASIAAGAWHHVVASWNVAVAGSGRAFIDNVNETLAPDYADFVLDYTTAEYSLGATVTGTVPLTGRLGEFYLNFGEFLDLSVEANRRKFITAGGLPVDLGTAGLLPTGTEPEVFFSRRNSGETPASFLDNHGSGGPFTLQAGAFTDGGAISL